MWTVSVLKWKKWHLFDSYIKQTYNWIQMARMWRSSTIRNQFHLPQTQFPTRCTISLTRIKNTRWYNCISPIEIIKPKWPPQKWQYESFPAEHCPKIFIDPAGLPSSHNASWHHIFPGKMKYINLAITSKQTFQWCPWVTMATVTDQPLTKQNK